MPSAMDAVVRHWILFSAAGNERFPILIAYLTAARVNMFINLLTPLHITPCAKLMV